MTQPTEHECYEMLMSMEPSANEHEAVLKFARAILAKWGAPQQAAQAERKQLRTVTYVCPVCAASLERQE